MNRPTKGTRHEAHNLQPPFHSAIDRPQRDADVMPKGWAVIDTVQIGTSRTVRMRYRTSATTHPRLIGAYPSRAHARTAAETLGYRVVSSWKAASLAGMPTF